MKIEKLGDILKEPIELRLKDKINEILEAMTCPKCGNIKGMVGPGICFKCDQKEQESKK